MKIPHISVPAWVTENPLSVRNRWISFHIRACAMFHNDDASISKLSSSIGLHARTLHGYMQKSHVPMRVCKLLEQATDGHVRAERINHSGD